MDDLKKRAMNELKTGINIQRITVRKFFAEESFSRWEFNYPGWDLVYIEKERIIWPK